MSNETVEEAVLRLANADPYLQKELLGEDFDERLSRFGLIVENANGNWDLSDRDENALRTANAVLVQQKAALARELAAREAAEKALAEASRYLNVGYYDKARDVVNAALEKHPETKS